MTSTAILTSFTPSIMAPEILEALLVGRERLAERIMLSIRETASGASRRNLLLIGPHGTGKTHLVSLIYHRLQAAEELARSIVIAWLREDEWGVTSSLDVLLRILRALPAELLSAELAERVEGLYRMPPQEAEEAAGALLEEVVGGKTLLVLVENLEDLFKGLGPEGQMRLRRYLQEHPFCSFLATAQSLFDGVTQAEAPFHGYFVIYPMEELTPEHAQRLMGNIADLRGDRELASFIQTPRGQARIRAAHHLAGGNHRIWVIFSQYLSRQTLDALGEPLTRALDDLTPYYQARMAWISPQQRKLVEFLCERRGAVPVKEIAQHCFMTHQTASGQLKTLREMRYVRAEAVGRDSYYELREPLMRFCLDVKKRRAEPVRMIVEFLRLWYEDRQVCLGCLELEPEWRYCHTAEAPRANNPRFDACLRDLEFHLNAGDLQRALSAAAEMVSLRGRAQDWYAHGYCLAKSGQELQALTSFEKTTSLYPDFSQGWIARGWILSQLGKYEKALAALERAADLAPGDETAAFNTGIVLCRLGRPADALAVFDRLLRSRPDNPRHWGGLAVAWNTLGRRHEALEASQQALGLGARAPLLLWIRAENLLALGRREEAWPVMDAALAGWSSAPSSSKGDFCTILRYLCDGADSASAQASALRVLTDICGRHGALMELSLGLARHIPALMSPRISDAAARDWLRIWEELAGDLPDFQISLQFLAAAVRYRSTGDRRILLEQPVEYRTLLAPLLAADTAAGPDAGISPPRLGSGTESSPPAP